MWRFAALLTFASPALSQANEAAEVISLVGSFEKAGVVGVLIAGLWLAWGEIKRGRKLGHDLRGVLVNCHAAREMWKTAFFSRGAKPDDPEVRAMLDREAALLKPVDAPS